MIQFYFLSIVLNTFAGLALLFDSELKDNPFEGVCALLRDETLRLVLGALGGFVALFKLISVVRGDVPVFGDLFPALAGLLSGFALLLEYYRTRAAHPSAASDKLDLVFMKNRRWLGVSALVSAFAHFLFPTVLFL